MFPKTTQFEKLLEAVPDSLVGVDQKGVIRFVNRQTELLFGYDRDQLIGEHIDTLVPEPLWQVYAEHRQDYFTDPRTRSLGLDLELRGRHQDGTDFPVNITMSLIDTGDVLLVITGAGEVTRQKKAVAKAELLDAIVAYSDDAIMGLTLGGIVTSWNPGAERMYGYSAAEMIGRSGSLLTPQDRTGELNLILDRIKDGRYVEHAETTLVRKDGILVPVSIAAAPIRSEDGTIVGASCVHRDVTRQRQAFEAAQRMAAIVQSSDEAIISRTLEGTITSWNPAAARMFGYSSEEIIGRPITVLIPANRAGEVIIHLAKISAGQRVDTLESMRLRKDGTAFPVALTVSPIHDANDRVVGASVIYRDVSELRHAAQYARSLIETALDPLVTISAEGTITDVNEATVQATGVPRDQLIGTDFSGYFTDPDKAHEGYQLVFAQGSVIDYPLTLRRTDGTLIEVLYNASVYHDASGNVLGVFAAARDVTTQRQLFEAAQRLAAIVESSQDAIIGGTLDGIITSWNPAAEKMYGYLRAEVVGRPVSLLVPPDRTGEAIAVIAKVSAGQHVEQFDTLNVRKDGTVFPISLTVSPIRDANEAVVGASVICRDVSELRHAAQYARSLIETALDPLVTISAEGTITDVNEATVQATGVPRDQLIGTDFSGYFTDPDKAHEGYQLVFAQGSVTDYPLTLRRTDAALIEVLYNASLYHDASGNVLGVFAAARDVTTQRQLFEAAQRLASIVEESQDAIIASTLDGVVTSWNPAAERMYGYCAAEIVGRSVQPMAPKDRLEEISDILEQVRAGQHVANLETERVRKDGSVFPVSVSASPVRDAGGMIIGTSVISRDLSEQRRALEVAQRLAAIVQNSGEAIVSGSLDGTITSWNPAAAAMFGYSGVQIVGKHASLLMPNDRASDLRDIAGQVRAGRHVKGLETKRVRKNGSVFPVALSASPVRGADGTVTGASLIYHDLSEQKGALATAQAMAAIVESSEDAIIARTLDGTITSWNPAAARLFGYTSAEIVGKHVGLLIPQDRGAEMISVLAKISAGQPVDNFATVRVRKDGTVFPVALTISPLHNEHGAVTGASVIYRDLSELRHAARYARSLIEAALDPMVTISPDGTITDTNEATVKVTGVPRHKLIGTDFSGYFTDAQRAHECYQRAFTQGSVTNYPLTLCRRDGARTDVLYNASVFRDEGGAVLGVCAVARDLSRH
jgi:PAS domain S-box-containing protein